MFLFPSYLFYFTIMSLEYDVFFIVLPKKVMLGNFRLGAKEKMGYGITEYGSLETNFRSNRLFRTPDRNGADSPTIYVPSNSLLQPIPFL